MKVVEINSLHNGSTGTIMRNIAKTAIEHGICVKTYSTYNYSLGERLSREKMPELENHEYYGSSLERAVHVYLGIITGLNGFFSVFSTLRLLRNINKNAPDIIHIHNIHQYCINIPLLFAYVKKHKIPLIWTLHDCWSFTGHCAHFDMINCNKWKNGCFSCPIYRYYPVSLFDNSRMMYSLKKSLFNKCKNMTIVTPSEWLANCVSESFLKNKTVRVINNGIDLSVFREYEKNENSDVLEILGVASSWDETKGLDVFIELSKRLNKNYRITLVGTNDLIDKKLPPAIVSIHKTENREELARLYSSADVFVNPTLEDTFPTVNIEALACGTPVITFKTGGASEIIDETCGIAIEKGNINELCTAIENYSKSRNISRDACRRRAENYSEEKKFLEYVELYRELMH